MAITRAQQVRQMLRDGTNYNPSKIVSVPKEFKAREDSPNTKLAYITKDEEKLLKKLKPGTPHKGPEGIPNYDSFDISGGYTSGRDIDDSTGQAGSSDQRFSGGNEQQERETRERNLRNLAAAEEAQRNRFGTDDYEGTTEMGEITEFDLPDEETQKDLKDKLRDKNPNPLLNFLDPRRRLYGIFPNNPINEKEFVDYLESQGVDVPQSIKDAVARGEKLSYDEFQELREFEPPNTRIDPTTAKNLGITPDYAPMNFSEYMASKGNFNLITGGDLGNLKDFKNPGTVINPLTGLPYTDIEFEKLKRESGQGASSYDRGPGLAVTGIPDIVPPADEEEETEDDDFQRFARLMADGGSVDDIEREAMFLGGITKGIKKAVKGIKKIAKSPIGKAAIGAFLFKGAGGMKGLSALFGKGSFSPFKAELMDVLGADAGFGPSGLGRLLGDKFVNQVTGNLTGLGKFAALGIPSALAGIMTDKQKDEFKEPDYPDFNMQAYLQNPYQYTPVRQAAEGGIMRASYQEGSKEPVAKKTMPLLDMDGKEMDFREEGGFVPIGRMEKAEDVPARLSKNEFVFTADAVRNAGDGDVDKGAEVMYNMMKNLESGGDVSEESQGLQGAREMFQTSKRLEEVL